MSEFTFPKRAVILAVTACIAMSVPGVLRGQVPSPAPAVIEAGRFRDSGRFDEAIGVLRRHRSLYPQDGDAARMHAQTLYWNKELAGARALYDSAVALHPGDGTLRLDYARMLMETGDLHRAREVLAPLVEKSPVDAKAVSLLGTIAYWEGDYTAARRLFEKALEVDSSLDDARRQLNEIRWFSAPWIRLAASGLKDDQPMYRFGGGLETGYYLTPLWSAYLRGGTASLRQDLSESPGWFSIATASGTVGVRGSAPLSHLDMLAEAGFFKRDFPSRVDWTGVAAVGFRPKSFLRLGVQFERQPYLHTAASLASSVMTNAAGASVDLDRKGWLGKAALQVEAFPDDNSTTRAYAWAMAPVIRSSGFMLQGGYSASYQNAKELRFVERTGFGPPSGIVGGAYYSPYYTPRNLLIHSVIGVVTAYDDHGFVARLGGAYGVRATEDAPVFVTGTNPSSKVLVTYQRNSKPWNVRASVDRPISTNAAISIRAEHLKTSFYSATTAAFELTWRLAPR